MTYRYLKYVIIAYFGVISIDAETVKKNVTIAKCCAKDEVLTSDYKCLKSLNSSWDLLIYVNQTLRRFQGKLPARWVIRENTRPQCIQSRIEPMNAKTIIPIINGFMISVTFDKHIPPKNFCLDYEYGIYCRPVASPGQITDAPLVKKCCGKNAIYSETNHSCILFNDSSYDIDVGRNISLVAGFPECEEKIDSVVAGKLKQATLTENGSLWMNSTQVLLPSNKFCLEHIFEQSGKCLLYR